MLYRELLDSLQMVAETEPSLLNYPVLCSVSDDEYFNVENIFMADSDNQFADKNQPYFTLAN